MIRLNTHTTPYHPSPSTALDAAEVEIPNVSTEALMALVQDYRRQASQEFFGWIFRKAAQAIRRLRDRLHGAAPLKGARI